MKIYRQSIHQYVKSAVIHYSFDVQITREKKLDENRNDFLKFFNKNKISNAAILLLLL